MSRRHDDILINVMIAGCLVAVIVAVVVGEISDRRDRARCTDNGGHFERRNCRESEEWVIVDGTTGAGEYQIETICDEVCVGMTAEAQPR